MSSNWKDQLQEAKRVLEEQKMQKLLEARAREREAQRPPAKRPLVSQPATPVSRSLTPPVPPKTLNVLPAIPVRQDPLPHAPSWAGLKATFNIGVDFGTSSTKVCARQHKGVALNDSEPIYLAYLDSSDSYLCPSQILIKNDRLYFGHEAERQATSDAIPLRHLKSCLACEVEPSCATAFAECSSMLEPGTGRCTGSFSHSHPLPASQLVTLYLGWVMRESREVVSKSLGLRSNAVFTYHVGLPLKQIDDSPAFLSLYEKISYQAWRISGGVIQGLDLNKAVKWLNEVTNEPIPNVENSPVQLAPEIVASLVPFLNGCVRDVTLTPGLYGLVDIGAWTADVAMFRYSSNGVVSFPVTSVRRTGCNLIDEDLRSGLLDLVGGGQDRSLHVLGEIRDERENHSFDKSTFRVARYDVTPPPSLLDYTLRVAAGKIWRQFIETVKLAHDNWKERYNEQSFSSFQVFILGGGSNMELLAKAPDYFKTKVTRFTSALPGIPANFKAIATKGNITLMPRTDYRRLAIAHGLAFAAGSWPEVTRPSQVEPAFPPPPKDRQTSEDLGYDEK